jgi:hypothetical protein
MTESDKEKILVLLFEHPNLENMSPSQLKIYLKNNEYVISIPTITKYKSLLISEKSRYYQEIGLPADTTPESQRIVIKKILDKLLRNRKKISNRSNYRNRIRFELEKFKEHEAKLKDLKSAYEYNNELKKLKKDICKRLNDIPLKTLNYLYNDIAKQMCLLPKRSLIVNPDLINEIDSQFKNGTIQKSILELDEFNLSLPEMIQIYIKTAYGAEFSLSMIQRYFQKYFRKLKLCILYRNL